MSPEVQQGYDFAKGAGLYLGKMFLLGMVLVWVINMIADSGGWGVDDSDKDGFTRSGLKVHTDHKTGIQYLSDGKGGLVRREGKQ